MKIKYSKNKTEFGPGVDINLTGEEVATAIIAYLVAHGCYIGGPRTIMVNGQLCNNGHIYVDPSGYVAHKGKRFSRDNYHE